VLDQVGKGHTDEEARRICGTIQKQVEGERCACGCGAVHLQADDSNLPDEVKSAKQPDTIYGSVDTLVARSTRQGSIPSGKMAAVYAQAVEGLNTAEEISAALNRAHEDMNIQPFARVTERSLSLGLMLGALDSGYEEETDEELPVATFQVADPKFIEHPFAEAQRFFNKLGVLSKAAFEQLSAEAKRRAFTIAGIHNTAMLNVARAELERVVRQGKSLRTFRKFVAERMESAGFTPANPSHVETVYRTNTLNSYNSGRHKQMTQPETLRSRPYWQIRTVNDGPPRQRHTHQAVHLKVLRANDPFWQKAYPPFGFNCRCRVVSLSQKELDDRGLKVTSGAGISGLPDAGFTSGAPTLLG
jgi:SPP1 gp7 family putative phage head morphogenesis protein